MFGIIKLNKGANINKQRLNNMAKINDTNPFSFVLNDEFAFGVNFFSTKQSPTKNKFIFHNNIYIALMGDIFNYSELKTELEKRGHNFNQETNIELIEHLYKEFGENFSNKLDGFFLIALFDLQNKRFLLVCDKSAIVYPCYYYVTKEYLVFSSNAKSILFDKNFQRIANNKALYEYFKLGWVLSPQTFFVGLRKIMAEQYLIIEKGKIKIKNYVVTNFKIGKVSKNLEKNYLKAIGLAVKNGIEISNNKKMGAFLSGGVDSGTIVAMMAKFMKEPFNTFSLYFEGSNQNETKFSNKLSEQYGTTNNIVKLNHNSVYSLPQMVWYNEGPALDLCMISYYFLGQAAKKKVDVIFGGDGNDLIYGYYSPTIDAVSLTKKIPFSRYFYKYSKSLPKFISNHKCVLPFNPSDLKRLNNPELYIKLREITADDTIKKILNKKFPKQRKTAITKIGNVQLFTENRHNNFAHMDVKLFGNQCIDFIVGRMICDANSLILREPLMNTTIINIVRNLPLSLKCRRNGLRYERKYFFKKIINKNKLLPKNFIFREKIAPVPPLEKWFSKELKSITTNILDSTENKDIFDVKYIKKIINKKDINANQARLLFGITSFNLWKNIFIDSEKLKKPKKDLSYYL